MSEWCELPLTIDSTTVDSGLYMANIIVQDLNLMNAVSWQSWTAVNGDGLMELKNGELVIYSRYYAYKHFSNFIKQGMVRIDVMDSFEGDSNVASTAFTDGEKTVLVLLNNAENAQDIKLYGAYKSAEIYTTDATSNFEKTELNALQHSIDIPAKSITTVVMYK